MTTRPVARSMTMIDQVAASFEGRTSESARARRRRLMGSLLQKCQKGRLREAILSRVRREVKMSSPELPEALRPVALPVLEPLVEARLQLLIVLARILHVVQGRKTAA